MVYPEHPRPEAVFSLVPTIEKENADHLGHGAKGDRCLQRADSSVGAVAFIDSRIFGV